MHSNEHGFVGSCHERIIEDSLNEIYIFDAKSLKFLEVNKGARDNLGYTLSELQNLTPIDLKPDFTFDTYATLTSALDNKDQKKILFSTVQQRKNGTHYPVEVHLQKTELRKKPAYVTIIVDMSEYENHQKIIRSSNERLEFLLAASPAVIYSFEASADHTVTYVGKNIEQQTGYDANDFMKDKHFWASHIHPDDKQRALRKTSEIYNNDQCSHEYRYLHADGSYIWVHDESRLIRDALGNPIEIVGYWIDVTERKNAEEESRLSALIIANTSDGAIITNQKMKIISVNPAFTRTTGYSKEEALGNTPAMLQSGKHDKLFYKKLWECLKNRGEWSGEIWNRRKNGEIYLEWLKIKSIKDDNNEFVKYYTAIFSDLTTQEHIRDRLKNLAYFDSLTTLPNRALFYDRFDNALERVRRTKKRLALLFLDLNGFKQINDTLGHRAGDLLLKAVAKRLKDILREEDTVARLGGDEFTIIISDIDQFDGAINVVEKIIDIFSMPFEIDGTFCESSTSIGVSIYPEHGETCDALIQCADKAMYQSKKQGNNKYKIYDT
ncbi:MAG: diguanylate cyclase [Gammaproteobacteria bacterium]|nr:diguanylate cyclase [Gammaproteobacteria bacterium]